MTRMLCCVVVVLLGALAAGCASVPVADTGSRGLLQKEQSALQPSIPVAPPSFGAEIDGGFQWPLKVGRVTSFFGHRRRDFHEGIDIAARRGTPIYAAQDGDVIYSARRIRGYGNMIVIKHSSNLATVYAHNRKNAVRKGEHVKRGQLVGFVGSMGKSTGPHVHFEIRKSEMPQDPLLYLPQAQVLKEAATRKTSSISVAHKR